MAKIKLTTRQLNELQQRCGNDTELFYDIRKILSISQDDPPHIADQKAFYQIFRNSPDAMIISSLETGMYIDVNDSFERYVGYEREELVGRTSLELSVWVDSEDREKFIEYLVRDGYVTNFEAPYRKKDGAIGIGLVSSQYIMLNNEKCLVSITRDITQYKHTQKLLTLAEERATIYEEVLNNASHEFRTPLAIINTSVYLAQQHTSEEKRIQNLNRITEQVSLMNQLVDNILLLTRLDVEHEQEFDTVHIDAIIETVINMLDGFAQQHGIQVVTSIQADLPQLRLHSEYFSLAIYQILKNAIEHSHPNNDVNVNVFEKNTNIVIEIQDNGSGIPDQVLPNIFVRFYRGTVARTTRGFGLGLPIVQKVADYLNCEINLETEVDSGTRFEFILPSHLRVDTSYNNPQ